jgi:hypothetical protein
MWCNVQLSRQELHLKISFLAFDFGAVTMYASIDDEVVYIP